MALRDWAVMEIFEQRDAAWAEVERLRAALTPFALLAQHVDRLRHPDDSTSEWRLRAADIRAARDALTHPAGGDSDG